MKKHAISLFRHGLCNVGLFFTLLWVEMSLVTETNSGKIFKRTLCEDLAVKQQIDMNN